MENWVERFWSKVEKTEGCWYWRGTTNGGYGCFWFNGQNRLAHRISYHLHIGAPQKSVIQTCNNKLCVNPDHLKSISRTRRLRPPYFDESSGEWRVPMVKGYAIIDQESVALVGGRNWSNSLGYAVTRIAGQNIRMHRLLAEHWGWDLEGKDIDHINHSPHDNRQGNLRVVTHQENCFNNSRMRNNTSGHRGVCWHKKAGKWAASIKVNRCKKYLGLFVTFEDAVAAYRAAALQHFGEEFCNQSHM